MIVMKKIFFFCFLGTFIFAGREFIQLDLAQEKLRELMRKFLIIRVQMNFGVKLEDFEEVSAIQRLEQIQKFDLLMAEFKQSKEYFKKNFVTPSDKAAFVYCSLQMYMDKKRYDKELAHYLMNHQGH